MWELLAWLAVVVWLTPAVWLLWYLLFIIYRLPSTSTESAHDAEIGNSHAETQGPQMTR